MKAAFWGKVQAVALAGGVLAATATSVGWGLRPGLAQEPKAKAPQDAPVVRTQPSLPDPDEPEKDLPKITNFESMKNEIANFVVLSPHAQPQPGDSYDVAMAKIMHRTAVNELKQRLDVFTAGARGGTIDGLEDCVRRVRDSELAMSSDPARQIEARQRFLRLGTFIVRVNRIRFDAGQVPNQDLDSVRYMYLEAMLQLNQATSRRAGVVETPVSDASQKR